MAELRFDGSVWCNLDVARHNLDHLYNMVAQPLGLRIIECYILQLLYKKDGQHPTELATAVGRPPTSFTPILDNIERKKFIERQPDHKDRRAILIYLTPKGINAREAILSGFRAVDTHLREIVSAEEWSTFERILAQLPKAVRSVEEEILS